MLLSFQTPPVGVGKGLLVKELGNAKGESGALGGSELGPTFCKARGGKRQEIPTIADLSLGLTT